MMTDQGIDPRQVIAEKHHIQRELDLLHLWHIKIEAWILEQAGIELLPVQSSLRVVESRK